MTEWKLVAQTRTTPVEQDDPVEIIVKCKHRDSALDVAEYIIDEIKRNSQSTYALKIKLANEYDAVEEERRWAIRMSKLNFFQRSANQLIKPNFVELEKNYKLTAYSIWAERVGPNKEWDHKWKIAAEKKFSTNGETRRYHHKYKNYEYYYDIWSNIHYGYVGAFCKFSDSELLDGAGLAQLLFDAVSFKKDIQNSESINGKGLRKYDDITDSLSVRLGIELFKKQPNPELLTIEMLMGFIEKANYPIRVGSKIEHECKR
ncbi:TPA: polymorphic toxin type 44 domain-containing protein [Photobacterium damselae]